MKATTIKRLATLIAFACASSAQALPMTFSDRTSFEGAISNAITDDYDNPPYPDPFQVLTDAAMSAALGETDYRTTGFTDWNFITGLASNPYYCAGCNGSFELGFTTTSIGSAAGVFGVGFDIRTNDSTLPYTAFVTFGDGSTENIALAAGSGLFFGITSEDLIASIHLGLADGGTTTSGSFSMDNLTIGNAVPAPATLALLGLGLAGIGYRRNKIKVA